MEAEASQTRKCLHYFPLEKSARLGLGALDALKPSTFNYATEKLLGDAMAMSEQASVTPEYIAVSPVLIALYQTCMCCEACRAVAPD